MKFLQKNNLLHWGKILLLYSPFVIMLLIVKGKGGHEGDMFCWEEWSRLIFVDGFTHIYKSWTNYLPLYHYILCIYAKLQGNVDAVIENVYKLRSVTLFFEFGSTLILFKLLVNKYKDTYKALFYSLFYFLNLGVLYNSIIWGQVDGILSFFVFAAVILAYEKRLFLSLLFFVLGLNMKFQAIVFLPIIALLLFPVIWDKSQIKRLLYSVFGVGFIQFLILLPFIIRGDLSKIWHIVTHSVGAWQFVSMNAYNMWYFFIDKPRDVYDTDMFLGITYKSWGLMLFCITSFFALWHFIKPIFMKIFKRIDIEYSQKKIWISCALIPLLFFFFNTEMHERYSHCALIFLALYAMLYKRPLVFILGSLACFLNMEDVLRALQTNNYGTLVFTPWFIACLYFLTIILLFIDLYDIKLFKKKKVYEISEEK